jgi:hypothetical protein
VTVRRVRLSSGRSLWLVVTTAGRVLDAFDDPRLARVGRRLAERYGTGRKGLLWRASVRRFVA